MMVAGIYVANKKDYGILGIYNDVFVFMETTMRLVFTKKVEC